MPLREHVDPLKERRKPELKVRWVLVPDARNDVQARCYSCFEQERVHRLDGLEDEVFLADDEGDTNTPPDGRRKVAVDVLAPEVIDA